MKNFMNFERSEVKNLKTTQKESFEEKKEYLDAVKDTLEISFGKDSLPKNLVLDMINIRKDIKNEIEKDNYVDEIDELTDGRIKSLVVDIYNSSYKEKGIKEITEIENGDIEVSFEDGEKEKLGDSEKELLNSLRVYFDSYRLAHNANKFRSNVEEVRNKIIEDNKQKKTNFFEEKEEEEEVISDLLSKYEKAGFSEEELGDLLKFCDLKDIQNLPIHKIHIIKKIQEIFSRFMVGDKAKYYMLSAGLLVPAIIQGYTPKLFSDAFKGNHGVDTNQVILSTLLSLGSYGMSLELQKKYNLFINKNYKKEGGVGEFTAENLTEMPPNETKKFGADTVKKRSEKGRHSYEDVFNTLNFDLVPTIVTLLVSVGVLVKENPILGASTLMASGIGIALNKYFEKKGKFWKKQRESEKTSEEMVKKLNDQLNAHIEIILAGEKERFLKEIKNFLDKEKEAKLKSNYFEDLKDFYGGVAGAINTVLAVLASSLSGGSSDKFVAALLYSQNFSEGIQTILNSRRELFRSLRNIEQMEMMFNGYAEDEKEKEIGRVGVDQINNGNIDLKNVNVEMDNKKILDDVSINIPSGSMAYIEGSSGAGKTTLMKIICGYYRPTSGDVKFGDVDIDNIKKTGEKSIYSKMAYLSQFPYLFEDSLKNNLKFGLNKKIKVSDGEIIQVLKDVGLYDRFGKNIDEKIFGGSGDSGKTSGGETSRIGLARILLKIRKSDVKTVFLDEPVASVDEDMKREVAKIINNEKLKRPDTTFIVISHDVTSFVNNLNCDVKIKMKKGKIVQE